MIVHRLINPLLTSNCYIIYFASHPEAVIIDPGNPDADPLVKWLEERSIKPARVILTHEHHDHIAGVNALADFFSFQLICSEACAANIKDAKKNFSFYDYGSESFSIKIPAHIVHDKETTSFHECPITFYETPGHSPGGMCIKAGEKVIFTGDTFLNRDKTPLNFPGSNKEKYRESLQKLDKILKPGMMVYPGHGLPFAYEKNLRTS